MEIWETGEEVGGWESIGPCARNRTAVTMPVLRCCSGEGGGGEILERDGKMEIN